MSSAYQIWYVYPTCMVWITTVTQCYFVPLCMHFNTTSRYLCEVWYLAKLWKRHAAATEPWFITTQLFLKLQGWMAGWVGTPLQYETCLVCNWPILCHFWLKIGPFFCLSHPPSLDPSCGVIGGGLHLGNATPPPFISVGMGVCLSVFDLSNLVCVSHLYGLDHNRDPVLLCTTVYAL